MTVNQLNISTVSDTTLISAATNVCRELDEQRVKYPQLFGKPTASQKRFAKAKTRENAADVLYGAFKSQAYFGQRIGVEA